MGIVSLYEEIRDDKFEREDNKKDDDKDDDKDD